MVKKQAVFTNFCVAWLNVGPPPHMIGAKGIRKHVWHLFVEEEDHGGGEEPFVVADRVEELEGLVHPDTCTAQSCTAGIY